MWPAPGSTTSSASGSAPAMVRAWSGGQSRSRVPTRTTDGSPRSAASDEVRRCSPIDAAERGDGHGVRGEGLLGHREHVGAPRVPPEHERAHHRGERDGPRVEAAALRIGPVHRRAVPDRGEPRHDHPLAARDERAAAALDAERQLGHVVARRRDEPRAAHALAHEVGVALGQRHERHPAHRVPRDHDRALDVVGEDRGEVVGGAPDRGALAARGVRAAVAPVVVAQDLRRHAGAAQVAHHAVPGPQVLGPAVREDERGLAGARGARAGHPQAQARGHPQGTHRLARGGVPRLRRHQRSSRKDFFHSARPGPAIIPASSRKARIFSPPKRIISRWWGFASAARRPCAGSIPTAA